MFTRNTKLLVAGFGLSLLASGAYGQVASLKESTFHPTTVVVEVKPLPLAFTMLPGLASIGAGVELGASSNLTTFLDGYAIRANLPNGLRSQGRQEDVPVIQKMEGYAGDLGLRYYGSSVRLDSWYGGAKVGYKMARGQWGYKDEKINHVVRTVAPGVEGGYRWLWENNVLVRLGAGADGNVVQENNSGPVDQPTKVTADAQERVEGYAQVAVIPRVDVGLGYMF